MREFESPDRARDAGSAPALDAISRRITGAIQVHVPPRLLRRALAKIDERTAAIGEADEHEPSATNVSRVRIRYCKGKSNRDCCVYRVSSALKDSDAHIGCEGIAGDDHSMARKLWLSGLQGDAQQRSKGNEQ